ncbi:TRAP transporter small permease [Paracoccus homiensis]|uniref:TRAP transporter small permease protein n=1 Tax=Paracoccus homiensis TaxID=364199 RepID=A0A1I0IK54_9RHOB|nr:TRAP transporter small permease [Paracoccus homiensis]SET97453.1 TRAP-type C4-dicarboxylate transport system, small permease component [Paracoccus homiensis]
MARIERIITELNRALVAGLLASVFVIVFANVVGRYGFGASLAWVEEAARHLMILGAFAGAGLALREGRLVAITTLPDFLPEGARKALRWGVVTVMFAFMATLLWLGIRFVDFGWNKETMSTGISRGIPYMAIPFGCALFLIHLGLFARRFVKQDFEFGPDETATEGEV